MFQSQSVGSANVSVAGASSLSLNLATPATVNFTMVVPKIESNLTVQVSSLDQDSDNILVQGLKITSANDGFEYMLEFTNLIDSRTIYSSSEFPSLSFGPLVNKGIVK